MVKEEDKKEIEFEFSDIFNSIKRNFKLFIISSSAISLISLSYAQLKTKVWQGEFQIVLGDKGETSIKDSLFSFAPSLSQLSGLSGLTSRNDMQTEVGILKSPSTLIPVFEFYKSEKRKLGKNIDKMTFRSWSKGFLDIKLTEKTSILNVKYKDSQKDLIIPILDRISDKYKNFSSESKIKDLKSSSNYLLNQINKYDKKSKSSRKKLYEFSIDNGLEFESRPNLFNPQKLNINEGDFPNFNNRIKQENKIKVINMQLDKIKNADPNLIPYLLNEFSEFLEKDTFKDFNKLESEIAYKSRLFKENDPELKSLNNQKKFLQNNLKKQIVNFLESEKILSTIYLNASIKPKNILIKYRELNNEVLKNEEILNKLQTLYTMNNLRLAERKKPWLLITEPTLRKTRFSPNKKRIFVLGSLIGVILSSIYCYLKDNNSKIIYDQKFLNKILNNSKLLNLQDYEESKWINILDLFISNNTFDITKDKIIFLELGDLKKEKSNYFNNCILESTLVKKFDFKDNIFNIEENSIMVLVTALGSLKYDQLIEVRNISNLKKIEFLGTIILH